MSPLQRVLAETRSALLVVDMQVDFCAADGYVAGLGLDTGPCRAVVESLARLIDAARDSAVPLIWAYADYSDDKVPESMRRKKHLAGIVRDCCVQGTPGYAPFGVQSRDAEPVFIKHCYSAFSNPDLYAWLQAQHIETLVIAGVQTNVCVESTLRDAHSYGFNVVIAEECVASHTRTLHDATLANVRALLGYVGSLEDVTDAWRKASTS
jgi:ureidoacrylate peracid hydrolase